MRAAIVGWLRLGNKLQFSNIWISFFDKSNHLRLRFGIKRGACVFPAIRNFPLNDDIARVDTMVDFVQSHTKGVHLDQSPKIVVPSAIVRQETRVCVYKTMSR